MASSTSYEMDFQGSLIEELGLKQYDRISAVVAELVANSYDADATEVVIEAPLSKYLATKDQDGNLKQKGYEVKVKDNGHGMAPSEANEKFLRVGRKRRQEGEETSPKFDRPVMGRKGIGKLAPFGLCKTIEIRSAGGEETEKGYEVSHFEMKYEDIKDREEGYEPEPLEDDGTYDDETGTEVIMKEFNHKMVPPKNQFTNVLSYRFSDGLPNFEIKIKDTSTNGEATFSLSETEQPLQDDTRLEMENYPIQLPDGTTREVDGYMALGKDSYDNEFQGVRIYVRGKLAAVTRDFNIESGFYNENTIRSYLVGEIHCDFLDEEEDLIQSNRQDILWKSRYGRALEEWGQKRVRNVAEKVDSTRRKTHRTKFFEKSDFEERVDEEFEDEKLKESATEFAGKLAETTSEDELDNEDFLEKFTEMIIQLAPHNYLVRAFQKIKEESESGDLELEELTDLIETTSMAQTHSLAQIAQEKIEAIETLESKISSHVTDEKEFHELIENAPWLLNPEWKPLTSEKSIKKVRGRVEDYFDNELCIDVETKTNGQDSKIPDLVLVSMNNKLIVVELKPPGHAFGDNDFDRFSNYVDGFEEFAEEHPELMDTAFPKGLKFEIVVDDVNLSSTQEKALEAMMDHHNVAEPKHWHEILQKSKNRYEEFLEAKN